MERGFSPESEGSHQNRSLRDVGMGDDVAGTVGVEERQQTAGVVVVAMTQDRLRDCLEVLIEPNGVWDEPWTLAGIEKNVARREFDVCGKTVLTQESGAGDGVFTKNCQAPVHWTLRNVGVPSVET